MNILITGAKGFVGRNLVENLKTIRDSVACLSSQGIRVIFDAEHFFDAYAESPEYALQTSSIRCATNNFLIDFGKILKPICRISEVPTENPNPSANG